MVSTAATVDLAKYGGGWLMVEIFCRKCGKETPHRLALVWLNKEWETYVCEVEGCNISVAIPAQEGA